MARRFGQSIFHVLECLLVPLPWLKVKRNDFGEIHHDPEYRPIARRTDSYRFHRFLFGFNDSGGDAEAAKPRPDQASESHW
jgi:hypothetical protein